MSKIDIRHIAKLARLHVDESEIEKLRTQMSGIVAMVENLPDFESESLELNANEAMALREDEVRRSFPRGEILANAPQTEAGCIVVPKTVE
jgi:aspartyl-tRNA(Asn)/glutamyl-tRNA(Gln) amidotransferase subunit C